MPLLRLLGVPVAADDLIWLTGALLTHGDDELDDLIERAVTHELRELSLPFSPRRGSRSLRCQHTGQNAD